MNIDKDIGIISSSLNKVGDEVQCRGKMNSSGESGGQQVAGQPLSGNL